MDVSKWDIERIMQLPDWCFGQKTLVTVKVASSGANTVWDMSELSYPDKIVLWEVSIIWVNCNDASGYIRLAYGEQLPTSEAMMSKMRPILSGLGQQGAEPRKIFGFTIVNQERIVMRKYAEPQGRKLVLEATSVLGKATRVRVHTIISSVPKEVPDWLFSGRAAMLS